MSASQLAGIQGNQPNLLGDYFYGITTTVNISSVSTLQTLEQFDDSIYLQPGGSSVDVATMPTVLDLVFRTAHISNTGLNITNIDGDLVVANGFVQSDVINVSTLNYNSLNPPITIPAISSITASTISLQAPEPPVGIVELYTGSSIGMGISYGAINTYTQNGFRLNAVNAGGGSFIAQTPLVPPNYNTYYQQTWDNGSPSTRFTAGTYNGGSYHIMSYDGTVVVDDNLAVNSTITADTGSVSSLNVSTINNYNLASDTANISTLTVSTLNNLNTLPTGISFFPDIAWNSTIGSEWVGTVSAPGLNEGSLISATLQLRPGYTYSDITTSEYCWLITTFPSTNTLTYFVASDPTTASSNIAISWAMTR